MLNFSVRYTNATPPNPLTYPYGSFKNESSPGALDGTEYEKDWPDDILGFMTKLINYAAIIPSGNPENIGASDCFDALRSIFNDFIYFDDQGTGTPNNIVIISVGAAPVAYFDGQIILFKAATSNLGAATVQINGLAAKSLTNADGSALIAADIKAGRYVLARFNSVANRFELLQFVGEAIPVGMEMLWPLSTPPTGFLEEDGSAISRTTYNALFNVLGTAYGVGDGINTFNLPDFRGEGLRGWDHGAGRDPDAATRTDRGDGTTGDAPGTKQGYAVESHVHGTLRKGGTNWNLGNQSNYIYNNFTDAYGGNETRMRNVYRMMIIKY